MYSARRLEAASVRVERRPAARRGAVASRRAGRLVFLFSERGLCGFRSTLVERTVHTAQGVLSGLYPDCATDECAEVELNGATTTTTTTSSSCTCSVVVDSGGRREAVFRILFTSSHSHYNRATEAL